MFEELLNWLEGVICLKCSVKEQKYFLRARCVNNLLIMSCSHWCSSFDRFIVFTMADICGERKNQWGKCWNVYLNLVSESGGENWGVISSADLDIIDLNTISGFHCSVNRCIVPKCEQICCVVCNNGQVSTVSHLGILSGNFADRLGLKREW